MLVSVVVITYHSAPWVVETLNSIAAQTHRELELIISDDGSKDDTVAICRDWLAQHQERFVRTELLTVTKNTGIAGNCNRGYAAAHGEWIKGIAGDDLLLPQCIEKGMDFARQNGCAIFMVAMQKFGGDDAIVRPSDWWQNATVQEQLEALVLRGIYSATPGLFCKKKLWEQVGGFSTRYPMLEDLPFYLKVLESGEKIFAGTDVLVKYRVYGNSVSQSSLYLNSYWMWMKECLIPRQFKRMHILRGWHNTILLKQSQNVQDHTIARRIFWGFCMLLDPIGIFIFLKKCFRKHISSDFKHQI